MQSKASTIFREKIRLKDKAVKLNYLRKTEFKEFMKTLDISCKEFKKWFYLMMNSIVRSKTKGKIAKGIKQSVIIPYGEQRDIIINNYFEQIFRSKSKDIKVENNRIFNFKWEIEIEIRDLSRSNAVGCDKISAKVL